MFFVFILLTRFSFSKVHLSDVQICLQSYFVDQIGITELKYQIGNLGYHFDHDMFNSTVLISRKSKHKLQISSPFRVHFIDSNYHYLQLPRLTFDYSKFASISPRSLHISSLPIMTMKSATINLTNILENTSFTVTDVYTTSRSAFVESIRHKILNPNETLPIHIYFCPSDLGSRTALILIRTSLGLIPYTVSFQIIATFNDVGIPTLFHQSNYFPMNLSLMLPNVFQGSSYISILFDKNLFDSQKSGIKDRYIQLAPTDLHPGGYFTFLHLISPTVSRNVPVFIMTFNRYLFCYTYAILLETVTNASSFSEAEIKIVNPTSFNFMIIFVKLRYPHSNLNIEMAPLPVMCAHFTTTVVGKVEVHGSRPGEVDATLQIGYELVDSAKLTQTIDIPVRGYVEYGSLEANETTIDKMIKYPSINSNHLQKLYAFYKLKFQYFLAGKPFAERKTDDLKFSDWHYIHVTNHFSIPVAILTAQTDSFDIQVLDFVPMLVQPGEDSDTIKIRFQYWTNIKKFFKTKEKAFTEKSSEYNPNDDYHFVNDFIFIHEPLEAVLTIETNATVLKIPIHAYNGQIAISENPDEVPYGSNITKSLGKVMTGSSTNFTFYISNMNPSGFLTRDYNATRGISVNGFWYKQAASPLRSHVLKPFSVEEFNMYVDFAKVESSEPRNDTISIGYGGLSFVQIKFSWTPIIGQFNVHSNLPRVLRFGQFYQSFIYINSTYPITMKLHEISTNSRNIHFQSENKTEESPDSPTEVSQYKPPIHVNYDTPFLRPGIITHCGNFSFTFDSSMFDNTHVSDLFNTSLDYEVTNQLWKKVHKKGLSYEIPLTLHFHSNMKVHLSLVVGVEFITFSNVAVEKQNMLLLHRSNIIAKYVNPIDCPVEFHMHINNINDSTSESNLGDENHSFSFIAESEVTRIVVQPHQEFEFNFLLTPMKISQTDFQIPVTSNASSPFFIQVHGNVEKPKLEFIEKLESNSQETNGKIYERVNEFNIKERFRQLDVLKFRKEFNDNEKEWIQRVFLINSGKIKTSIGDFDITNVGKNLEVNYNKSVLNPFFVSSNCSQFLDPGEICSVDISVKLFYLKNYHEKAVLSAMFSDLWDIKLKVDVLMSPESFSKLTNSQRLQAALVLLVALFVPVLSLISTVRKSMQFNAEVGDKLALLDQECELLSISKRIPVGTQVVIKKAEIGGGSWVPFQTEVKPKLTLEAEEDLENLLNTLR